LVAVFNSFTDTTNDLMRFGQQHKNFYGNTGGSARAARANWRAAALRFPGAKEVGSLS
jgi:hypothetical protein